MVTEVEYTIERNAYNRYSIYQNYNHAYGKYECCDTLWNKLNYFKTEEEARCYIEGFTRGIL